MKKCEICHKTCNSDDAMFNAGGHEPICYECAEQYAQTAKAENREIEITEAGNGDEWKLCQWCDELFPVSELREEVDLGNLCDRCVNGITSRGEEVALKY